MSDWWSSFTSDYAGGLAVAITTALFALLLRLVGPWALKWYKTKRNNTQITNAEITAPTQREVRRYSQKLPVTETEWQDAIDFLKYDVEALLENSKLNDTLSSRLINFMERGLRAFQIFLLMMALIGAISAITGASRVQAMTYIATGLGLLVFSGIAVVAFVSIFLESKQTQKRMQNVKVQIAKAISTISPNLVFTFDELGSLIGSAHPKDLPALHKGLYEMGLQFEYADFALAYALKTQPTDPKVLRLVESIADQIPQFVSLPQEQKGEVHSILIQTLRHWPVTPQRNGDKSTRGYVNFDD